VGEKEGYKAEPNRKSEKRRWFSGIVNKRGYLLFVVLRVDQLFARFGIVFYILVEEMSVFLGIERVEMSAVPQRQSSENAHGVNTGTERRTSKRESFVAYLTCFAIVKALIRSKGKTRFKVSSGRMSVFLFGS